MSAEMQFLAHRGASADAPENTLAAFREAIAQGADGVELDARLCGSGEVVVCHDARLDRVSDVGWEVARTGWWKLQRADVGTRLGSGPERIPLLAEVLALLPPSMTVNVELKCESFADAALADRAVEVIRAAQAQGRVIVSSFHPACLARLAAVAPELRRGYLIDPDRSWFLHGTLLAPALSSHSVHPHFSAVTPERVERWREGGLRVAAWTVDDAAEAQRLEALGVDYLITNRPAALRRAIRSRGRS